jgi:hypothetical protein
VRLLVLIVLGAVAVDAQAGGRRRGGGCPSGQCSPMVQYQPFQYQSFQYQPQVIQQSPTIQALPAPVPTQSFTASTTQTQVQSQSAVNGPKPDENYGTYDGLDEVNACRAQRGLPPFIRDPGLSVGAARCARTKANYCHTGHLNGPMSDFSCLDPGVQCSSTGADGSKHVLGDIWGWSTCCTYEPYMFAGAAWAIGPDGCRYMSLFVR